MYSGVQFARPTSRLVIPEVKRAETENLAHIRRETLDIFNRLHSVADDAAFVRTVQAEYAPLPLLRPSPAPITTHACML
jgi:hypothetical protein